MSILVVALSISILLFLLTYIQILHNLMSCYKHQIIITPNQTSSNNIMSNYALVLQITSHLRSTWNHLLRYTIFCPHKSSSAHGSSGPGKGSSGQPAVKRYEGPGNPTSESARETDECAVCLCEIEHGEEIQELRCKHLFHKVCLDGWTTGGRRATCPLCRGPIARQAMVGEDGTELVMFQLWNFRSSRDQEHWWLR
ncbi:hypothetical protein Dimus_014768 [Dionaea muscipula]